MLREPLKRISMWRPLWVVVLVVATVSMTCGGGSKNWDSLPDCQKLMFIVRDYQGTPIFVVGAFLFNCANYRLFLGDPDKDCESVHFLMEYFGEYFGGRVPLLVFVNNLTDETQYFFPTEFSFTQGPRQWNVEHGDYYSTPGGPFGGAIRPGVIMIGCVAIPKSLDPTKPFRLWMRDDYGETAPCESEDE